MTHPGLRLKAEIAAMASSDSKCSRRADAGAAGELSTLAEHVVFGLAHHFAR
jgi:hypothetical protein